MSPLHTVLSVAKPAQDKTSWAEVEYQTLYLLCVGGQNLQSPLLGSILSSVFCKYKGEILELEWVKLHACHLNTDELPRPYS